MTRIGHIVVTAAFAILAACAGSLPEIPADLAAELGEIVVEAPLQNTAPGWAISGTARLVAVPRFPIMQVQVEAAGLTPGPHGWHIHSGGCRNPGAVVVALSAIGDQPGIDEPIVAGADGTAAEDAVVPASSLTEAQVRAGEYSLHIHNTAGADPGRSIACAEL